MTSYLEIIELVVFQKNSKVILVLKICLINSTATTLYCFFQFQYWTIEQRLSHTTLISQIYVAKKDESTLRYTS